MELLLQWLDELDDGFFVCAMCAPRLATFCVYTALGCTLAGLGRFSEWLSPEWTIALLSTAASCVLIWTALSFAELTPLLRRTAKHA